jgi:hypothetical protein
MKKKYIVKLTEEERTYLVEKISSGVESASSLRRAWVLLKADQGEYGPAWSDERISEAYEISSTSVYQIRRRYHQRGLKGTIARKKPDRIYERCLDGEAEAHLIAMVCSEAPEGYERWTLRLLRDEMVALEYVKSVSHETIRTTLKKTNLSPG